MALLATGPGTPSLSCRSCRCVAPSICSRERRSEVRRHDRVHKTRCRSRIKKTYIRLTKYDRDSQALLHFNHCYHLNSVWGILKLPGEQLKYNLTVENGAPDRLKDRNQANQFYISRNRSVFSLNLDALTLWWNADSPLWKGKLWFLQLVCWRGPSPGRSLPTARPPPCTPDSTQEQKWQMTWRKLKEASLFHADSASYFSDRSPLLSLLASDWLPISADLLPAEALLWDAISWEELCEELFPLSVSSQPPPTCPGHRWVDTVVKTRVPN